MISENGANHLSKSVVMADSLSPKITGESVLSGCGKLSGGCTGRSLSSMVWSNLDRGKPVHWLKVFEWPVLFVRIKNVTSSTI